MILRTHKRYKLRLRFNASANGALLADAPGEPGSLATSIFARPALSDVQVRAVRALQLDLPAQPEPFAPLAESQGLIADELLVHATDLLTAGYMSRLAAMLNHRRVGARANVMVAWRADKSADAAGMSCAALASVSHCYLRETAPDWPYDLYTMIHGRSRDDCNATIREIAAIIGIRDRMELWTEKEYAKRRIKLFGQEESAWEQAQI